MARLVRATHDLDIDGCAAKAPRAVLRNLVFMGHPDKPGDDGWKGEWASSYAGANTGAGGPPSVG